MKSASCRWLTAVTLLCFAYPATLEPTLAVERPCTPTSFPGPWATKSAAKDPESTAGVTAAMAQLPLSFEPNVGQTDSQVEFLVRGAGYGAYLTNEELVLSLPRASHADAAGKQGFDPEAASPHRAEPAAEILPPSVVRMRLTGADFSTPVGELPLEAKTNYFIGADPEAWRTDVPNFARVRYTDVYPGVDLVYYGNRGRLEYDFVIAPGANPDVVAMEWEGVESVEVDENGTLVMKVEGGELRQASPVVYQDGDEGRSPVSGAFELIGAGRVGVRLGAFDPAKPLVIDPVLVYSTFLGGSGSDLLYALAVDTAGSAYVTGYTGPTASNGATDVVVTKLSPTGDSIVYSTIIGGNGPEAAWGIALDSSGAVHVSGETESTNFPTIRAFDTTFNGGQSDAFLAKLSPLGNVLDYSTYLGGSADDRSYSIAIDRNDIAYVVGRTESTNFPTANSVQSTFQGGVSDAFVAKLRMSTSFNPHLVLDYSTYLGGDGHDNAEDVAFDASGAAFVVGTTGSTDFPLMRAIDTTSEGSSEAFLSKLTADGRLLSFSTYLGGRDFDRIYGIALTRDGAICVAGGTLSPDFPTTQTSYDPTHNGFDDGFVTKLRPGSALGPAYTIDFSMFLGSSSWDSCSDVAVTLAGTVYVTGITIAADFPTLNASDSTHNGSGDAFVSKLSADGASLVYSTFLGGSSFDAASSIGVDSSGAAYVAGRTESTSFPTMSAYDSTFNGGGSDGFIAKLQ